MDLDRGRPWNYMLQNIYPYLRGAQAELYCTTRTMEPAVVTPAPKPAPLYEPEAAEEAQEAPVVVQEKPRYWSIHTNMLYDALAIPNAGAEVYLGRNFSLAANWWYAWWKTDRQHRYWRTYGGYIAPRYWFGKAAHAKPLTGHHVGLYGQMMLYDFEWGGIGNLSGTPGKNIFHHPTWGGGIEYGFALPIKRRLNLDFTIGLGYLRGRYWKYEPMDDHYVWISKHIRNWWGPTKVEVSLVWLLGRDNVNKQKGGVK